MSAPAETTPPAGRLPREMTQLTFNGKGLVHWMVSDVAGSIASRYGLREEAEALGALPVPSTDRRSPNGTAALLERTRTAVDAAHDEVISAVLKTGSSCLGGVRFPEFLREAEYGARRPRIWRAPVRAASEIMHAAVSVEAHRDGLDEINGYPVDEDSGWLGSLLWSMETDLRNHAREVTRWPLIEGEVEMILGGNQRFWSAEELEAGS
ncbi:hypothetical protein FCK90_08560 [Kocuria coralli]|uniref:Uncharacterized protein n=1 Tax=Kocuria coralli TaxID=1461025 RepID=A0A5J5KWW3_9MICC|nr:hypothetical protein [Kocuria coralli]KAA9394159.1 hypothetical protein FCK90_08560 [Kocuria coralli]